MHPCVEHSTRVNDLTCSCDNGYEENSEKSQCLRIPCGDFTNEKGQRVDQCTCVDRSSPVDSFSCECHDGYESNNEKTECLQIPCGDLTNEKGQRADQCTCVANAGVDLQQTNSCRCFSKFSPNSDKTQCKPVILCGILTEQFGNIENVEDCRCVENAQIDEGKLRCKCDTGFVYDWENNKCVKQETTNNECVCTDGSLNVFVLLAFILFFIF